MDCRPTLSEVTRLHAILDEGVRQPTSLISIHAAELLIRLKRTVGLLPYFRSQKTDEANPYQMGVWRILAMIEDSETKKEAAVQQIRKTLLDKRSAYRVHAMESLAKINAPISVEERNVVHSIAASDSEPAAPFALWRLAQLELERRQAMTRLTKLLLSENEIIRFRSAYTLWHLRPLPDSTLKVLLGMQDQATPPELHRLVYALAGDDRDQWESAANSNNAAARYFVALQLAECRDDRGCSILKKLLDDADLDVQSAAAFSILKLASEETQT